MSSQHVPEAENTRHCPQAKVKGWYHQYYSKRGVDRNDVLNNPGVLMQAMAMQRSVLEVLRAVDADRGWSVLDVGCGGGGSLQPLLGLGFLNLHGIDVNAERIALGLAQFPNMKLKCGDASRMDYADGTFDMVMESGMFMTLTDNEVCRRIASDMVRVVRPGGYIMIADWRYSFGCREYNAVSRRRLADLFGVGTLTDVRCCRRGSLIPPIGRFLSRYLPSMYFPLQRLFPFLAAQVTTMLQKRPV